MVAATRIPQELTVFQKARRESKGHSLEGLTMNIGRTFPLTVLLLAFSSTGLVAQKESKGPKITEDIFRKTSSLLLEDPLNKSARDWARLILIYALDSSDADVVIGREEWRWTGLDHINSRSLQLLAAYEAGNIQSQLNSGVKRNDRYSGLLTLFRVYRAIQKQDEKFKLDAVEAVLSLHQEGKLLPHLQQLDEKKPKKLTPLEEQTIRELMRTR
jgi:hypothetical protein